MSYANTKHTSIIAISVLICKPCWVNDCRSRVLLRNMGNNPTSFLGAVPTCKLLDLPEINGGALGTPALPSGLGGIPALPSPLLLGG